MTWTQKLAARPQTAKKRLKNLPGLEHLELREVLDATLRFDFGTADSPLDPLFTRVTEATKFDATKGYGWVAGNVQSRDRGGADATTRDFNFGRDLTFGVNLANGTYNVSLSMGDAATLHDQDVYFEGQKVDSLLARKGEFVTRTYTVGVTDGQLSLRLYGLGGFDDNAVINSVVITPSAPAPKPPSETGTNLKFDFGTANSPVSPTFTKVTEATKFDATKGYGWVAGNVQSRDRGGADANTRDFNFANDLTFGANVPNGTYTVSIVVGDAATLHDQDVYLEGKKVDSFLARTGQFVTRTYTVDVTDGQLTLRLDGRGGADGNAVLNALTITGGATTPPPAPVPIPGRLVNNGPVNEGSTATVSFSNLTGGPSGYTYSYDFDNDGRFEITRSSSASAVVPASFLADGPFTRVVRGVVTDSAGAEASFTTSIQVNNVAPTVTISNTSAGVVGSSFAFQASASDPSAADQAGLTYRWDFGDGGTATGPSASHVYTRAGDFTVTVTATDKDGGRGVATTPVRVNAPTTPPPSPGTGVFQFDMAPANTNIQPEGWLKVDETTVYNASRGYGWTDWSVYSPSVQVRDRGGNLPAVVRTIATAEWFTFRVDVPNGDYTVRVITGDIVVHDGELTYLQGTQVDTIATRANEWIAREYPVTVTDGSIRLRMHDAHDLLGQGVDFYVLLNGLQVFPRGANVPAPPLPTPPPVIPPPSIPSTITNKVVFGPPETPVPSGFTLIPSIATYNEDRGFGWEGNGVIWDRSRNSGVDEVRYFATTLDGTFRVDVPPGVYTVTLTMGDAIQGHDQSIYFNYHEVDSVVTQANVPLTKTYTVNVYDGHLRAQVFGYGPESADENATLHSLTWQLTSTPLPARPYSQHYDFGTSPPGNALAEGYQVVNSSTIYSPGGFGWVAGNHVEDRDHSFNTDYFLSNNLTRDFSITHDATFKATLPNGTYAVTLIIGEIGSPHDQRMYLQGQLVDTIHTLQEDMLFNTYIVTVTDGVLTFRLQEITNPNTFFALINGMDVVRVG